MQTCRTLVAAAIPAHVKPTDVATSVGPLPIATPHSHGNRGHRFVQHCGLWVSCVRLLYCPTINDRIYHLDESFLTVSLCTCLEGRPAGG